MYCDHNHQRQQLVENIDAVWNDGVAPELALDFDCQHVDSTEGLLWWLGGFGFFTVVYNVIKSTSPENKKPCVNRKSTYYAALEGNISAFLSLV